MILPFNIVEDDTNKIILYLSDSSQPAVSRYIAGRMIGFVADVFLYLVPPISLVLLSMLQIRKDKIKGTLFERSRILCQDHDIEVRKILAREVMFKICCNISSDQIEMHLLDKVSKNIYNTLK